MHTYMRFVFICLLLPTVFHTPGVQAQGQTRLALVIGNAGYAVRALPNSRNDAQEMSAALRRLGFTDVSTVVDGDLLTLRNALEAFGKKLTALKGQKVESLAVVYYSGHGVQTDGQNYLIPVGASIRTKAQLKSLALPLQEVLDELNVAGTSVVILDACRDDPLPAEAKSGKKGLVPIEAPDSSLIAFAASAGETADVNREGKLSLYTEELLKRLETPGLKLEDALKGTRVAVRERSEKTQSPRYDSGLGIDLVLRPGNAPATASNAPPIPMPVRPVPMEPMVPANKDPLAGKSLEDTLSILRAGFDLVTIRGTGRLAPESLTYRVVSLTPKQLVLTQTYVREAYFVAGERTREFRVVFRYTIPLEKLQSRHIHADDFETRSLEVTNGDAGDVDVYRLNIGPSDQKDFFIEIVDGNGRRHANPVEEFQFPTRERAQRVANALKHLAILNGRP
jgi:hypothetical protein